MPSVTHLDSDSCVTAMAESHEIVHSVSPATRQRKDVVDFLGGSQLALLLALLAERVCFDKADADALPASAVAFVCLRLALEMVVMIVHLLLMLGTVLLADSKPTAAGVSAGTLGFVGHRVHLLAGKRKALRDCSHKALSILFS